ncbi:interaptin-like [Aphidius gifuensis]|uniref:interaptin-like n=1 Tax=Aphidius gifuensis TaxID=684658 RepID=UPI001CDCBEAE|nr:interaptin-like [Aphidius gifuensis]
MMKLASHSTVCQGIPYVKININDCDEIAELEAEFRKAYMMKELEAQIAEKLADNNAIIEREKLRNKLINKEIEKHIKEDNEKKLDKLNECKKYKNELEQQILHDKNIKKYNDEKLQRERQVLIEVDKIIDEEYEIEKINKRIIMINKLRREQMLFNEIKYIKKCIQNERELLDESNNKNYIIEINKRHEEINNIRIEKFKKRQIIIDKVAKLFIDNQYIQQERDKIINNLITEDINYNLIIKENNILLNNNKIKKQLAKDLLQQMYLSLESELIYRKNDKKFIDDIMNKIMEDDKIKKLTIDKQRIKKINYQKDLKLIIDNKRKLQEESLEQLKNELKIYQDNEIARKIKIDNERRQLIKIHSANL